MRRWNGWGDDSIIYSIPASAVGFLNHQLGRGHQTEDTSLDQALKQVPKPQRIKHSLVSIDPLTRLLHARGQSFPDWVALRYGQITSFPDGVAYPSSEEDVRDMMRYAHASGIQLIPYGGGTSVVGHVNPLRNKKPIITIDLSRMNRLLDLDSSSLLATFNAGVTGPDLEAQLRARGFTLGHFPQSFEYSTLGGWVATRSSGQQSLRYGRIEKLFAGGRMETPLGELVMPTFPASAAGPDLRQMVLGSEGRLGILTQITVHITPVPEREEFHAVFFPDFYHGIEAVQQILIAGLSLCMLRLSTADETTTILALAGHKNLIGALERLLRIRGLGESKCMLLLGFSGTSLLVQTHRKEALAITGKCGGIYVGKTFGQQWHKNRFRTAYLRNSLWDMGYGLDTIETATDWGNTPRMVEQMENALRNAMVGFGERVHVFTHLSHVYPSGSSVYTTFLFRLDRDPAVSIERWQAMKKAACQAIVNSGGTISHQHGIGVDHLSYLVNEKGILGLEAIKSFYHQFDPKGIMNPGKLVD